MTGSSLGALAGEFRQGRPKRGIAAICFAHLDALDLAGRAVAQKAVERVVEDYHAACHGSGQG